MLTESELVEGLRVYLTRFEDDGYILGTIRSVPLYGSPALAFVSDRPFSRGHDLQGHLPNDCGWYVEGNDRYELAGPPMPKVRKLSGFGRFVKAQQEMDNVPAG